MSVGHGVSTGITGLLSWLVIVWLKVVRLDASSEGVSAARLQCLVRV